MPANHITWVCPKGHDKRAVGKTKRGMCKLCERERSAAQRGTPARIATSARYTAANKQRLAEYGARYIRENRDRLNAKEAARRAMKLNQECICCSKEQKLQLYQIAAMVSYDVDHRVPLALGGHHCVKNLQPLSEADHSRKTADDVRRIRDTRVRNKLLRQWPRPSAVGEIS
jgi:hypothetical protein